jgi:anti-sigma B factor antagonist
VALPSQNRPLGRYSPRMNAAAPLEITTTDTGLALVGEIDAYTAPALSEAIGQCEQAHVVIDMAAVEFVDSSGLRVLIEAHQSAQAEQRRIQLSNPSPAVSRLLEISGIDDYLNVAD